MSFDCTICAEGRHGHLCKTSCAMGTTYDEDSNQCTPLGILPTLLSLIFLARALSTDKRKHFLSLFVSFSHSLSVLRMRAVSASISLFFLFPSVFSFVMSYLYDAKESFMSHMD